MKDNRKLVELDVNNLTIKDVNGDVVLYKNNEKTVEVIVDIKKDLANFIYKSVSDIDLIAPLQELSATGKCKLTNDQLEFIEKLVNKSYYTLPVKMAITERIKASKTPVGKKTT